jgi:hypothetical protein
VIPRPRARRHDLHAGGEACTLSQAAF